jgi:tetratricopeptide (TPR) repeat protein
MKPLHWLAALLAVSSLALAQSPVTPTATPATKAEAIDTLERGRQALLADDYVAAGQSADAVMRMRNFQALDAGLQFRTFLFASFAASGRDDNLSAHEWMTAATQYDEAGAAEWLQRARYATYVDDLADAALALGTTAQRWPAALVADPDDRELVGQIIFDLRRDPVRRADYLQLGNALFAAKFTREFDTQPDGLWSDLILDALEHQDMGRARELAARVENTDTLLAMRIDKRFDQVVQSEPKRYDLGAALKRNAARLETLASRQPRRLAAFVELASALADQGRYADILARCDAILRKVAQASARSPAYDDLDRSLNWVYDHKARALSALGRWDESIRAMEEGSRVVEHGSNNVSQAINLAYQLTDAGQPQKALDVLAPVDWTHDLSPYGRMQLQYVRYVASLQLGNRDEAEKVLAYLREHHEDAADTWNSAMLESGDEDGAAAALIAQLRDPQMRGDALKSVQQYPPRILSARARDFRERWTKLVARADVLAVVNDVGRIEKVPIYGNGL